MAGQKLKRKGGSGAAAANRAAPAEPNAKPRYASKAAAPSPDAANNYGKVALHMLSGELLVEEDLAGDRWYDCAPDWPAPAPGGLSGSRADWAELSGHALAAVTRAFERKAGTSDDGRQRVLNREKTVGDKIAVVTLMVQESPVYRLDEMRMLLGFAKKQGRRERGPAIDALKDLFVNDLLPDDRRLVPLASRNFAVARNALSKRHLAYAMFESELKDVFREFLTVVEECSKDAVVHFKMKAARVCFDLLVAKPENEKALLAMLVNELGSPERKVASSASYYLNLLVSKHHPVMKLVVVREVELLVHRPNVGLRTRYYAVSFLNQIRFSTDHDVELARRLVRIYMDLFAESVASDREGVKQKGSGGLETKESRLMGALLTGVNRAFPYSKPGEDDTDYSKQFESLFQVAHAQSLTSATQALSFLLQVAQTNSVVSDRFYRALYSRIMDTAAASESKQALFMNLLFKAMKADVSAKRVKAYSKRLLQSALQSSPGFAAGALLVLSEVMVMRRKGLLKSFVLLSEGDDADEDFQDVDDGESDDVGKRPEPVGTESIADGSDDGGDAHDSVVKQSEEEDATRVAKWPAIATPNAMVWGTGYDPSKRDPIHARAGESCLWEIVALCSHYHPSVVSFAKRLREEMAAVEYKGDPLKDFTLGSFLDKFSYRKPKKHVVDSLHGRRSSRLSERPLVNTEEFRQLGDAGEIEEDEKFYLRFFQTNPERTRRTTASAEGEADPGNADVREDDGDSEEEAFELAMKEEMKRLGGGADLAGPGDIDDVDEDEVRAFASTFGEDVLDVSGGSSSSESDNADGMRLIPSEDDEESDDEATRKRKKKMAKAAPTFAPVEYYADVIALEEQDHADDDDDDSSCGIDDDEDRALAILCGEEDEVDEEDEAEIVDKENGQRKGKGKRKGSGGEARGTGSGKASKKRRRQ